MRRYLLGGLGAFALALSGLYAGAGCNEPPDTTYGNPNALDRKNLPGEGGAEPLVCGAGEGGAGGSGDGGCPSFATDIFPNMAANGKWRCADLTCHGGASPPNLDGTSPAAMLENLKAINVTGKSYVNGSAADTTLICNMQGTCGSRMPKAPGVDPTTTELCVIDAWLNCGSPP